MIIRRRRPVAIGAMAVALAAVAATLSVAETSASPVAATAVLHLPEKSVTAWRMPLDRYVEGDVHLADYAESLLVEPCMRSAGYSWDVPYQDPDATPVDAIDDTSLTGFDAGSHGYHPTSTADTTHDAWRAFAGQQISDTENGVLTRCVLQARETLPRLPSGADLGAQLTVQAAHQAEQSPAVRKAASSWNSCMGDTGGLVPDDPAAIPSDAMRREFDLDGPGAPSAAELELASKDAGCRQRSGYTTTLYDTEWNIEVSMLAAHQDVLTATAGGIARNAAEVRAVIAARAPDPGRS